MKGLLVLCVLSVDAVCARTVMEFPAVALESYERYTVTVLPPGDEHYLQRVGVTNYASWNAKGVCKSEERALVTVANLEDDSTTTNIIHYIGWNGSSSSTGFGKVYEELNVTFIPMCSMNASIFLIWYRAAGSDTASTSLTLYDGVESDRSVAISPLAPYVTSWDITVLFMECESVEVRYAIHGRLGSYGGFVDLQEGNTVSIPVEETMWRYFEWDTMEQSVSLSYANESCPTVSLVWSFRSQYIEGYTASPTSSPTTPSPPSPPTTYAPYTPLSDDDGIATWKLALIIVGGVMFFACLYGGVKAYFDSSEEVDVVETYANFEVNEDEEGHDCQEVEE